MSGHLLVWQLLVGIAVVTLFIVVVYFSWFRPNYVLQLESQRLTFPGDAMTPSDPGDTSYWMPPIRRSGVDTTIVRCPSGFIGIGLRFGHTFYETNRLDQEWISIQCAPLRSPSMFASQTPSVGIDMQQQAASIECASQGLMSGMEFSTYGGYDLVYPLCSSERLVAETLLPEEVSNNYKTTNAVENAVEEWVGPWIGHAPGAVSQVCPPNWAMYAVDFTQEYFPQWNAAVSQVYLNAEWIKTRLRCLPIESLVS